MLGGEVAQVELVAVAGESVEADVADQLGGAGAFDAVVVNAEVANEEGCVLNGEVGVGFALGLAGFKKNGCLGAG